MVRTQHSHTNNVSNANYYSEKINLEYLPASIVGLERDTGTAVETRILTTGVNHNLAGITLISRPAKAKEPWKEHKFVLQFVPMLETKSNVVRTL